MVAAVCATNDIATSSTLFQADFSLKLNLKYYQLSLTVPLLTHYCPIVKTYYHPRPSLTRLVPSKRVCLQQSARLRLKFHPKTLLVHLKVVWQLSVRAVFSV
jgi:hypothetical protein